MNGMTKRIQGLALLSLAGGLAGGLLADEVWAGPEIVGDHFITVDTPNDAEHYRDGETLWAEEPDTLGFRASYTWSTRAPVTNYVNYSWKLNASGLEHEKVKYQGGCIENEGTTSLAKRFIEPTFGAGSNPDTVWIASLHMASSNDGGHQAFVDLATIINNGSFNASWGIYNGYAYAFGSQVNDDAGSPIALTPGEAHLFIAKLEKNAPDASGSDRYSVWVNPQGPILDEPDATGTGSWWFHNVDEDYALNQICLKGWYGDNVGAGIDGSVFIDEIQMAGTFDDLPYLKDLAIPEPASMTLLALGGLLILRRR